MVPFALASTTISVSVGAAAVSKAIEEIAGVLVRLSSCALIASYGMVLGPQALIMIHPVDDSPRAVAMWQRSQVETSRGKAPRWRRKGER